MQSLEAADRVRAIRAAATSGDRSALPQLVDRLDDEDALVRFAAINALGGMTGERFGFAAGGSAESRAESVARWRRHVSQHAGTPAHAERER